VAESYNPRGDDVNIRARAQMLEYELISDRVAASAGGRVLDWGCGWGQISDLLLERSVDVVAFDYRPDEPPGTAPLERFPRITAHFSDDPVALPFPDDHFDAVVSCGVLEHVEHPDASLDELHRILRPGGQLLVYKLPNRFSYLERLARAMGLYYHGLAPHDRVYDQRSACTLLTRHDFRVVAFRRTNLLPLSLTHPRIQPLAPAIWGLNGFLRHVPGLGLLATNLELEAIALGRFRRPRAERSATSFAASSARN
jgi:SAM-dependent methyltransferase